MNDATLIIEQPSALPSAAATGSAIRPHEEQTPLERVLRCHLWYPNDILARGAKELPKCVKAKEYRQAADWQELMRKAESELKDWTYILELYEQERVIAKLVVSYAQQCKELLARFNAMKEEQNAPRPRQPNRNAS